MALTKRNYVSGETVITADNLNDIQDELIRVAGLLGKDIQSAIINDSGHLILTLTDGTTLDAGVAKGAQGEKGATGPQGPKGPAGPQGTGAEVFYIGLAGSYPNYTCPVAMADIKAAYEAGKVLECRCAMGDFIATLPLFIPMPIINTWIFSGSGALTAMNFPAQSLTIAINNGTVQASNTQLASTNDIPAVLPNPKALTVKIGSTTVTYDGSSAQTVEIADGTEVSY